jgi:hypothetical protein
MPPSSHGADLLRAWKKRDLVELVDRRYRGAAKQNEPAGADDM